MDDTRTPQNKAQKAAQRVDGGVHFIPALRMGWPAVIVWIIAAMMLGSSGAYNGWGQFDSNSVNNFASFFQGFGLQLLGAILFAPTIVRLYLVAAKERPLPSGLFYFGWSEREVRYLLTVFLFGFLLSLAVLGAFLPAMVVAMISGGIDAELGRNFMIISAVLVMFLLIWFVVRATLILPTAAIENRTAFESAFDKTKGKFWRLLIVYILIALIFGVVQLLVGIASFILGLVFGATGLGVQGWTLGGSVLAIITVLMSVFNQAIYIGMGGILWWKLQSSSENQTETIESVAQ